MILAVAMVLTVSCGVFGSDYETHWAKNYIDYVVDEGIFNGVAEGEFAPDINMTRGMFAAVLAREYGIDEQEYCLTPFSDVAKTEYYTPAILWGHEKKLLYGVGGGKYNPNDNISRQDAAVVIKRYLEFTGKKIDTEQQTTTYKDDGDIADYAKDSVYYLQKNNIMNGHNQSFNPKAGLTRAEMSVIISKIKGKSFENYVAPEEPEEEVTYAYLGNYKITCYCSGCNSPKGSRATAIGVQATAGEYGTVAVSPSLFKKYGANTVLYIDGIGYRKIQDKHGNTNNVIDVYVGEGRCSCSYNSLSGRRLSAYVVN